MMPRLGRGVGAVVLGLALLAGSAGAAAVPAKQTFRHTKDSVPWAMAGYKLVEYFFGMEGHRALYDGQELTVTDLVSSLEPGRNGQWNLLLGSDRVVVVPADPRDPQFLALRAFYEREKPQSGLRSRDYRSFYIKATVRGTCAASVRAGRVDLRGATLVAWYGVNIQRSGRTLGFSLGEQFSAERIPYYQFLDWSKERQQLKGALLGVARQGRQMVVTVERSQCFLGADPLALAAEVAKIAEVCKANVITKPLHLAISGYPTDSSLRRFNDVRIVSWQVANPQLMLFDLVDNVGEVVDLKAPEPVVPEKPAVAATEPEAPAETVQEQPPPDAKPAPPPAADADLKVAAALVAAATNLLARQADDPCGRQYLRLAGHLCPGCPPLAELQGKLDRGEPVAALPQEVTRFDLIDLVMARIATLSEGRKLHLPVNRRPCAFYVALARELEVGEDELAPVVMGLRMYGQTTDLEELAGFPSLRGPAPDREVAALAGQLRGDDPAAVDRLLAAATALKVRLGDNVPLDELINRLEQYRRYWDEPVPCPDCAGKGQAEADCHECNGSGRLSCKRCQFTGQVVADKPCPKCGGSGRRLVLLKCKECGGVGTVEESATCPVCNGTGMIVCLPCHGTGKLATPCERCQGGGRLARRELPRPEAAPADAAAANPAPAPAP